MITQRAGIIPADDTGNHRTNRTNPHPHQNLNDNRTMTSIHCFYQRPPARNCCDLWLLIHNRLPINESPMKRRHVVVLVSLGEQLSILTVGTFYSLNTMHAIPTLISQHTVKYTAYGIHCMINRMAMDTQLLAERNQHDDVAPLHWVLLIGSRLRISRQRSQQFVSGGRW